MINISIKDGEAMIGGSFDDMLKMLQELVSCYEGLNRLVERTIEEGEEVANRIIIGSFVVFLGEHDLVDAAMEELQKYAESEA